MRIWMLALSILLASNTLAATYRPPVEKPNSWTPQAWFYRRADDGRWCAFQSAASAKTAANSNDYSGDEGVESAWIRYRGSLIASITVSLESEDAYVEDVYHFDASRRLIRMVRTGHYLNDPLASLVYTSDAGGKLSLTAESKLTVRRMKRAKFETYWSNWNRYDNFESMPFRDRIQLAPLIGVSPGCGKAR